MKFLDNQAYKKASDDYLVLSKNSKKSFTSSSNDNKFIEDLPEKSPFKGLLDSFDGSMNSSNKGSNDNFDAVKSPSSLFDAQMSRF